MHHPPYSPDLAPCDYWLFPKLKNALKGQRFSDIPDIQCNVTTLLRDIPENDF
jgi:transposase